MLDDTEHVYLASWTMSEFLSIFPVSPGYGLLMEPVMDTWHRMIITIQLQMPCGICVIVLNHVRTTN